MSEHDLVIRGGNVIDGTGAPQRTGDVAIDDGLVTAVGSVDGRGAQEIDADGALVTPGFVDIHTHYDGQALWDGRLAPSSWHGVTTVVMSNCGVGFAPVHAHDHQRLIELMEGVEDIPGTALHEGLAWDWESFPEYLDALEARPHDIDFAAQVPHAALRLYVMGDRCAADQEATPEDIEQMALLAAEAVDAGALGFTTSRTRNHRASTGEHTPTLRAARAELIGIAEALGSIGKGVLQVVSDFLDMDDEVGTIRAMASASGRPLSISLLQNPFFPTQWRSLLDAIEAGRADGLALTGQVAPRPVGILLGLQATLHPFLGNPSFMEVADLPFDEKLAALRDPERRRRVLSDADERAATLPFENMFELGDPPDYEPQPEDSVAARAGARGIPAAEHVYDLILGNDGRSLLYVPFLNYADGNLDPQREMLAHDWTVPGLGDGGAHVGTICDGSFPTTLLTLWGRDRERGTGRLDLPFLVQRHTSGTARTVGLHDRGVLAPGYRADVNVIDLDGLRLRPPEIHHDLPAGGRRLLQKADGYRHAVVAGVETYRDGEPTDAALPGRLVRGAQPAPA